METRTRPGETLRATELGNGVQRRHVPSGYEHDAALRAHSTAVTGAIVGKGSMRFAAKGNACWNGAARAVTAHQASFGSYRGASMERVRGANQPRDASASRNKTCARAQASPDQRSAEQIRRKALQSDHCPLPPGSKVTTLLASQGRSERLGRSERSRRPIGRSVAQAPREATGSVRDGLLSRGPRHQPRESVTRTRLSSRIHVWVDA